MTEANDTDIELELKQAEQHLADLKDKKDGYPKRKMGMKIKEARKSANLTQAELANVIGINRTTLTNIEKGTQAMRIKHLCAVCKLLKLSANDLLDIQQ